jgi:hypothetical protein
VLGDPATGVVAVPAEARAGHPVQPGDGPAEPGPVGRAVHALEHEQVADRGQNLRDRRTGCGQCREPVGLDLGRVGAALDHHLAPVGEHPSEHGADEAAGQRFGADERGKLRRPAGDVHERSLPRGARARAPRDAWKATFLSPRVWKATLLTPRARPTPVAPPRRRRTF